MALKFFLPTKPKKENLTAAGERKAKTKTIIALVLGMDTKLAIGASSMVMTLVALTAAVSHVDMGTAVDLIPGIVVTIMCTIGAVGSAKFANKVDEKMRNRAAGIVLILVSAVSWILSA